MKCANEADLKIDMTVDQTINLLESKIDKFQNERNKSKEKYFYGLFFALLSAISFSMSNIFIKKAKFFSASDIATLRYIIQLLSMLIVCYWTKENPLGPSDMRKTLLIRGIFGTLCYLSFNFSIKFINPSETFALYELNLILIPLIARFYLKEKFSIINSLSLVMSIIGVFLIAQPSFIFKQKTQLDYINNCSFLKSNVSNLMLNEDINFYRSLGIASGLFSAMFWAFVMVFLKKLAIKKVHYSVTIIYPAYIGIPVSILMSLSMYLTGNQKNDMKLIEDVSSLIYQITFLICSGLFGVLSQILINISLKYEETTKVTMIYSTDLLFTFLFQYVILSISPNLLSTVGAFCIFASTFFILIFKTFETNSLKDESDNQQLWKKCLFFKF